MIIYVGVSSAFFPHVEEKYIKISIVIKHLAINTEHSEWVTVWHMDVNNWISVGEKCEFWPEIKWDRFLWKSIVSYANLFELVNGAENGGAWTFRQYKNQKYFTLPLKIVLRFVG